MAIRLDEIAGLMVEKKSEVHSKYPTRKEMTGIGEIYGFNEALELQGSKEIELNKMALMRAIACHPIAFPNLLMMDAIESLADAIITNEATLLEVKKS